MKKILTIVLINLAIISTAAACDVCGCSLGGNYYGILPLYNKSFVGVRWSQAHFHAYVAPSLYLPAQESNDTYAKVELWGRYYLTKRLQLMAFVPYMYNHMDGTEQKVFAQGLGDVSLLSNYVLVNTAEEEKRFKHTLLVGGGVKLPTGKFSLTDQGKIINRNFQMGTGSTDFIVNAMYTLRYGKAGMNVESAYKMNTRNADGYRFGNQFRTAARAFFWQKVGDVSLLPNAGLAFEQAGVHTEGDIIQANTGGTAWLASAGLDVYFGRFTMGATYQKPTTQHYNSDPTATITSSARWTASLTFSF